ncbi:P27 family phage terminase small subunit [Escherichia coli]|nr:P27 family phage terminase small subunit [Escherichia coli]
MAGTAGRSGRRPKPTARKALAGNPGKRALNKDEPVFTPIKGVEPPEWFAEEDLPLATIMWQLTTKELCGQGLLCVTDLAVLERWCVAYEFWRRAVKNIARQGNTITGAMGGMVKNPELTAKKEQEATITRYDKSTFTCSSACSDAVNAPEWRYYWQVNMPAATNTTWMTCGDPCDSALRIWGDTVVECVLNKLCPSHTYVIFKYPE